MNSPGPGCRLACSNTTCRATRGKRASPLSSRGILPAVCVHPGLPGTPGTKALQWQSPVSASGAARERGAAHVRLG